MLEASAFRQPVVFFANGFGDHLLALPAIRALARIFPGRLSLIALSHARTEFFSDIDFSSVVPIRFVPSFEDSLVHHAQKVSLMTLDHEWLAAQVRGCDLFISLAEWHSESSRQLLETVAPLESVGFFEEYSCSLNDNDVHVFDKMFAVARVFDPYLKIEDFVAPPSLKDEYQQLAQNLRLALMPEMRLITIHSDTKRKKMWSPSKFVAVLDAFLAARPNYLALIVGLWSDLPLERIRFRNRVCNLVGIPLNLAFALVGVSDLFIGVDSCMLHSADLFNVPGVGIFGPSDPVKWGFRFAQSRHVSATEIEMINVEEVIDALMILG